LDYLFLIPVNLLHRSLRTWLTLSGIVIGVLAIIILVSLGDGLKASITDQLDQFGSQNIIITPGSLHSMMGAGMLANKGKLSVNDVERIKRIPGIDFTSKCLIIPQQTIKFKKQEFVMSPVAYESNLFEKKIFPQFKCQKGRFYKENERNVIVLGHELAYNTFDKPINVGSFVYIGDKKFKVVGVLEYIGSMDKSDDLCILMNYNDARDIVDQSGTMGENEVSMILVRLMEGFDANDIADRIAFELRSAHKVKEDDFTIMTAEYMREQIDSIIGIITIFLGLIAGISLIVSAVGVSNTMFTAVLERTQEIGVMKSLGAMNKQIMLMFITESALICSIGGIIGIIISLIIIIIFNYVSAMFNLGISCVISPVIICITFLFSILIGICTGIFPAIKAANLDPIISLRYE